MRVAWIGWICSSWWTLLAAGDATKKVEDLQVVYCLAYNSADLTSSTKIVHATSCCARGISIGATSSSIVDSVFIDAGFDDVTHIHLTTGGGGNFSNLIFEEKVSFKSCLFPILFVT